MQPAAPSAAAPTTALAPTPAITLAASPKHARAAADAFIAQAVPAAPNPPSAAAAATADSAACPASPLQPAADFTPEASALADIIQHPAQGTPTPGGKLAAQPAQCLAFNARPYRQSGMAALQAAPSMVDREQEVGNLEANAARNEASPVAQLSTSPPAAQQASSEERLHPPAVGLGEVAYSCAACCFPPNRSSKCSISIRCLNQAVAVVCAGPLAAPHADASAIKSGCAQGISQAECATAQPAPDEVAKTAPLFASEEELEAFLLQVHS